MFSLDIATNTMTQETSLILQHYDLLHRIYLLLRAHPQLLLQTDAITVPRSAHGVRLPWQELHNTPAMIDAAVAHIRDGATAATVACCYQSAH